MDSFEIMFGIVIESIPKLCMKNSMHLVVSFFWALQQSWPHNSTVAADATASRGCWFKGRRHLPFWLTGTRWSSALVKFAMCIFAIIGAALAPLLWAITMATDGAVPSGH